MSLKFVPRGAIKSKPAFVQMIAWFRTGDKQLSDQMVALLTDAYVHPSITMSLLAVA